MCGNENKERNEKQSCKQNADQKCGSSSRVLLALRKPQVEDVAKSVGIPSGNKRGGNFQEFPLFFFRNSHTKEEKPAMGAREPGARLLGGL